MNWRICLYAVLVSLACLSDCPLASAQAVFDQGNFHPPYDAFTGLSRPDVPTRRVQTFTVGIAGLLHHVEVALTNTGPGRAPEARIIATSGGVPAEVVLATSNDISFPRTNWHRYDLSAAGLYVDVGEVLGIELIAGPEGTNWLGNSPGQYAAGVAYFTNPQYYPNWETSLIDNWFFTFVVPAVPAATRSWGDVKSIYR